MKTTHTFDKKDISKYIDKIECIAEKMEQVDMLASVLSGLISETKENYEVICNLYYRLEKKEVNSDEECV